MNDNDDSRVEQQISVLREALARQQAWLERIEDGLKHLEQRINRASASTSGAASRAQSAAETGRLRLHGSARNRPTEACLPAPEVAAGGDRRHDSGWADRA